MSGLASKCSSAPELSGPTEAGLDFVDDEQDAVVVGALPQTGEEPLVGGHVAALAQHRLDEERRGVCGRRQRLQDVVELAQREVGGLFDRPAEMPGVGERCDVHASHQRGEAGAELGARRRHRRRRDGAAVEAAVEDDDVRPAGRLPAQPKRRLDGLTARVREEHPIQTCGQHLAQPLHERQKRAVHDGGVLRVDQRADLALGRLDHAGVAMPGAGHADARGEVEVPAIVFVVQQHAFSTGGQYAGRLFENTRELRGPGHVPAPCLSMGRLSTISVSDLSSRIRRRRRG